MFTKLKALFGVVAVAAAVTVGSLGFSTSAAEARGGHGGHVPRVTARGQGGIRGERV